MSLHTSRVSPSEQVEVEGVQTRGTQVPSAQYSAPPQLVVVTAEPVVLQVVKADAELQARAPGVQICGMQAPPEQ